jgi:Arc/MetJ family transcription regulator
MFGTNLMTTSVAPCSVAIRQLCTASRDFYVHMIKRTTIEIDQELLARAKRALGCATTRATIEEALRRAAEQAEDEHEERVARLRAYLTSLATHVDLEVLKSDEMWR